LNEEDLADPILAWPVEMEGYCCQECFEKRVSVANVCRHIHDRHYLGDSGFDVMCCIFLSWTRTKRLLAKAEREASSNRSSKISTGLASSVTASLDALADAGDG
jgi:hypothetical protein